MEPPRPISGASRRTQESLPVFNLYPSTITKDSKAQHILGLSRTELQSARSQSLKPQSQYPNLRNPTLEKSIERAPLVPADIKSGPVSVGEVESHSRPVTQHDEGESPDVTTWSRSTSLRKFPSTSTLRSFYETATSSTRDLVPAKESPKMSPVRKSNVEPPRPFRFFKSSKLRSIKETKTSNKEMQYSEDPPNFAIPSRKSSVNRLTKSNVVTDVSVVRRPSAADDVQPIASLVRNTSQQYRGAEHLLHEQRSHQGTTNTAANTPYAKINVRRPKAGTTDWFDDLEGLTSDEDDVVDEDFTRRFVVNDHGSFQSVRNSVQSPIELNNDQPQDLKLMQPQTTEVSELPADTDAPLSSPGLSRNVTRRDSERSTRSTAKSDPLAEADLRHESVLHLSDGEAENDNEENDDNDKNDSEDDEIKDETKDILLPLQPRRSSDFRPTLRNSLTLETCEESDVEIGMAHTVKPTARLIGNRPLPIKIVDTKGTNSACSTPSTNSLRATPEPQCNSSGSVLNEELDTKDMDEDALLSSFPATPTSVHLPRRQSARSSASFSDDRSVVSMKMMPVTRQEENLISAMRMKRAAMKRAEKAAARGNPTNSSEHADKIVVASSRTKSSAGRSARLSEFAMLQYGPPLKDLNQEANRPLRSILTDSYGSRSSTAPLLTRYLADTQLFELPISPTGQEMSRISRTPSMRRYSLEQFPRPQSYQSTASGDSQGRNADIIVLNNLNSGSTTQTFPSQLRIESPFVAWEKTDAAAVH